MIEIILAGDPVGKGRPRFSRLTGAVYTPAKTARYEDRLAWAAQSIVAGKPLLVGPISVLVRVFVAVPLSWPRKKREAAIAQGIRPTGKPDADNFAKCLDALNKVVWLDDSQIVDLHVYKMYSDQPRMEILVKPIVS